MCFNFYLFFKLLLGDVHFNAYVFGVGSTGDL